MIVGRQVALRPIGRDDLPFLQAWANDVNAQGEFNMFGLRRADTMEAEFAEHGYLGHEHGRLMVIASSTGQVVGCVSYHQVSYGPNSASRSFNIGVTILADHRGQGYGTEAQRLLADYLFATFPIARVEASTDVSNLREQQALEKAGFTREGVLRKAQWRAGEWHDLAVYSKLRGE
jgi:RimJ/RimL family protein N-acetyltransferase